MIFRLPYYRRPKFETAFTVYRYSENTSKFRSIRGSFLEVDLSHGGEGGGGGEGTGNLRTWSRTLGSWTLWKTGNRRCDTNSINPIFYYILDIEMTS